MRAVKRLYYHKKIIENLQHHKKLDIDNNLDLVRKVFFKSFSFILNCYLYVCVCLRILVHLGTEHLKIRIKCWSLL